MLDHASLGVTNIDRSRRFYDAVLRSIGLVRIVDFGGGRGSDYGAGPGSPGVEFAITQEADVKTPIAGTHLCFRAPSREAVDLFYSAALVGGGRDDGGDHRNFYKVGQWSRDGQRVERMLFAGNSWDRARAVFRAGVRRRPRSRYTIRQRSWVLEKWPPG